MKFFLKTLILSSIFISATLFADTGSLRITISDANGNPVSGATIEADSEESLTTRTGVSDENGQVRLSGLPPSHKYRLSIDGAGYENLVVEDVVVVTSRNLELDFTLPSSAITEETVVTGARIAIIDTSTSMIGQDITLDLTESLPTERSYQSYLQLVPGTKPTLNGNPSSKSGVNYSDAVDAQGRTSGVSTDNVYYIDGVDVTDNVNGTFGARFNTEIIQEQNVITGGIPAEYRGAAGLISRVVTKSGGNEFHGSINYYLQNDSLVADNKNLPANSFSTYDTAFTLGGPIVQDKLWFFTSFQKVYSEDDVSHPSTGELMRTVTDESTYGFAKLTWQATDADKFVLEFFNDPTEISGSDLSETPNNRDRAQNQGGDNYKLAYSHSWDNLLLTLNAYSHEGELSTLSANNDTRNDVAYLSSDFSSQTLDLGGRGSNVTQFRNKQAFSAELEYFLDTNFGSHEIKTGVTSSTSEYKNDLRYTGDGAQYSSIGLINSGTTLAEMVDSSWAGNTEIVRDDYPRIRTAMESSGDYASFLGLLDTDASGDLSDAELDAIVFDSTAGNPDGLIDVYRINMSRTAPVAYELKGTEFYIQDSWSINQFTISAGLRAEKWEHFATDGSSIYTFDWEIAPRLSLVYDIDGTSKVWGFSGRYYDPIRTDMTSFAGTLTGPVRDEQIYVNDQWLTYRTRGGSQTQDAFFAPTTKTPYTDEILLGYSRLLTDEISGEVTYTKRVTKDILEDYDLGLYTDPALGDYTLPLSYFGYSEMPDSNYVIATLEGGEREYEGVEFTVRKRKSNNWQMLASYTYNLAEGNSNSDGNADFQGDVVWLDPRAPGMYGDQPGNIEHLLKFAGTYNFDFGLELGAVFSWNSGLVYSETWSVAGRHLPNRVATPYENGGVTSAWIDPNAVGAHTSAAYGTLDLRAKYTKNFGDYSAEFFLDIFNALDDQAVTREQDLTAGDQFFAFGDGMDWVSPRRFYLGARLSF